MAKKSELLIPDAVANDMNTDTPQASKDHPKLKRALEMSAPFADLSSAEHEALLPQWQLSAFAKGQRVGHFDSETDHGLWLIVSGEVELADPDGDPLENRGEGEVFGHAIVFDASQDEYMPYQAISRTDTELAHCHPQALAAMAQQSPMLAAFLSRRLGDRLRALHVGHRDRLSDLKLKPLIAGTPDQTIQQAAQLMSQHGISSLPLVEEGALVGIATDRDLRSKVLAKGLSPSNPIASIMTTSPLTAKLDARIDDAMLMMMQKAIHHLPVVNAHGAVVGMVSAGDLLRTQAPHPLRLARDIQRAPDLDTVIALSKEGPGVLSGLVHQGSEVTEVGRIASLLTDTITQRLLVLAEEALGPAPIRWCWVGFGSQARMEQGLISDQDNGLILADTPNEEEAAYFKALARWVCDGLNACGYVYCNGGVMAMGRWRMSLEAWQATFYEWMRQPDPQSVMNCSIFFDQRAIAGHAELLTMLQSRVLEHAKEASIFLRFLAAESMRHHPALGLFNRFVQETDEHQHKGINLKKGGVLPIVDLARVRALEGGLPAVHTEARLNEAAKAGVMNEHDADDLMHALRFIGNVRLKHQVRQYDQGQTINHLVEPDALSRLHQRYLRSAFGIVKRAQVALASRYQL